MLIFSRRIAVLFFFLCSSFSWAETQMPETLARNAIVVDVTNDAVLYEKDADILIQPASMSKMMTAYVVFEQIGQGNIQLSTMLTVPQIAYDIGGAHTGSSNMNLQPGDVVSVENLLKGLITASGNDAAITLATSIAGSEGAFAQMMTTKAEELDLTSTFGNSTGLTHANQKMSPRDLAILTQKIIQDYPQFFPLFSAEEFTYKGVTYKNRNELVVSRKDVDGMKTGYTQAAGYCLVATAERLDRRVVVVVAGTSSPEERLAEAEKLLDWAFESYQWNWFFSRGDNVMSVPVAKGVKPYVDLIIDKDITLFMHEDEVEQLEALVSFSPLEAPIRKGQDLAQLIIKKKTEDDILLTTDLFASHSVKRMGFLQSFFQKTMEEGKYNETP